MSDAPQIKSAGRSKHIGNRSLLACLSCRIDSAGVQEVLVNQSGLVKWLLKEHLTGKATESQATPHILVSELAAVSFLCNLGPDSDVFVTSVMNTLGSTPLKHSAQAPARTSPAECDQINRDGQG